MTRIDDLPTNRAPRVGLWGTFGHSSPHLMRILRAPHLRVINTSLPREQRPNTFPVRKPSVKREILAVWIAAALLLCCKSLSRPFLLAVNQLPPSRAHYRSTQPDTTQLNCYLTTSRAYHVSLGEATCSVAPFFLVQVVIRTAVAAGFCRSPPVVPTDKHQRAAKKGR